MQLSIYEMLYDKVQIDKPIRLIELFAGYGSQALALSYLGVNYERWKIVEWNYKSTHAYRLLHCNDVKDYASDKDAEEITRYLCGKGLSRNWNEPMTVQQIERMPKCQQRQIYNDMIATHNLGNITSVTSQQLEIDNDHAYILTYSFFC